MFPHDSYLAGCVAARQASNPVNSDSKALIVWTRVHAIVRSSTWGKSRLSGYDRMLTCGHVESPRASDLHHADGSESCGPRRSCGSRSLGSPSDGPQSSRCPPIMATRGLLQSAGFPSNGGGTSWKNSTIAARSSHDRGVIEPRSRRFYRGIVGIRLQSIGWRSTKH